MRRCGRRSAEGVPTRGGWRFMRDRERDIDDILKQAVDAKQDVDPVLLDRIAKSIGSDLHPVAALPPSWLLASGLLLICGTVAVAGAMLLGLHGVHQMS